MPNIEDVRKKISSYRTLMKRQGDFTIYASNYVEDVEFLLGLVSAEEKPAAKKSKTPGVRVRKKKVEESSADSD